MNLLLQTLLFFFLTWLGFKILWEIFGYYVLRYASKKTAEHMRNQFFKHENFYNESQSPEFEKEVTLDPKLKVKIPREEPKTKRRNAPVEDVDFEEI